MDKIIICLNGKSAEEIANSDGVIISVNWDSLLPTIEKSVRLRPDEFIEGLVVNDTDIRVKIGRKKGRKTSANAALKEL